MNGIKNNQVPKVSKPWPVHKIVFWVLFLIWMVMANHLLVKTIFYNLPYFSLAMSVSHEDLQVERFLTNYYKAFSNYRNLQSYREAHPDYRTSPNFYNILKACTWIIPETKSVQVVVPQYHIGQRDFLEGQARYVLYPRNYGDNRAPGDYILVYGVKDYACPEGFIPVKQFTQDSYLFKRGSGS